MGSVAQLHAVLHPILLEELTGVVSKKLIRNTSLLVSAMLECQTANTMELANALPMPDIKKEARCQIVWRYLKNENVNCEVIISPAAKNVLHIIHCSGEPIILSMDQTEVSSRYAILMIAVKFGNRALPIAWHVEIGEANIGYKHQEMLLERVKKLLPENGQVLFSADRFYPSSNIIKWLHSSEWSYRIRLKKNSLVEKNGVKSKAGDLLKDTKEHYFTEVSLFGSKVKTNIGILHEKDHPEAWIIAMNAIPSKETVLEYSGRWCIEPMFSDFKSRGFGLEDSQLSKPDRAERLILIMALGMYWCVSAGLEDALNNPTYEEKKQMKRRIFQSGFWQNIIEAIAPGSLEDCEKLKQHYSAMTLQYH